MEVSVPNRSGISTVVVEAVAREQSKARGVEVAAVVIRYAGDVGNLLMVATVVTEDGQSHSGIDHKLWQLTVAAACRQAAESRREHQQPAGLAVT